MTQRAKKSAEIMESPSTAVKQGCTDTGAADSTVADALEKRVSRLILSALEGHKPPEVLTELDRMTLEIWQLDLLVGDRLGVQAWPQSRQSSLEARLREARLESAVETDVLNELLRGLASGGIPALVLKGAAFARFLYPKPWCRPHGDIDVMVPEDSLDAARRICEALGYRSAVQVTARSVTAQRELRKDGVMPIAVDLHGRLVNPLLFDRVSRFHDLHARSVPLTALGSDARTLDRIDALLHMLLHRIAHHYRDDSPLWLLDVHLLATSLDDASWREADRRVREWQIAALAGDGLAAARALFGTQAPVIDAWRETRGEPSRVLLDDAVTEWRIQQLSFRQTRGVSAKAAFLAAHLFPPADYMLQRYGTSQRARLPELYVRRVVEAAWRTRRS